MSDEMFVLSYTIGGTTAALSVSHNCDKLKAVYPDRVWTRDYPDVHVYSSQDRGGVFTIRPIKVV